MQDIVENLREEAVSSNVAYTEFMLEYKKDDSNTIYCFYEGSEDLAYYPIRVKNITTKPAYKDYICGGKENVLEVNKLIKSNTYYKQAQTGYFVDADFDDNSNVSSDIYVTPTYSIENLYCLDETLESVLGSEFGFKRDSEDLKKCQAIFKSLLADFNNQLTTFNAWLACQSDYRQKSGDKTRLNIDKSVKKHFETIVSHDLSNISSIEELSTKEKIELVFSKSPKIGDQELDNKIQSFSNVDKANIFRGKFQLRFLVSFLNRLPSISGTDLNPFTGKYTSSLRFEYVNTCSNLSQYVYTPSCLKSYILTYLN